MLLRSKNPFLQAFRGQANNILNIFKGLPLTTPPFSSMTLDLDDVAIARHLLKAPETWHDESRVKDYEKRFAQWNGSKSAFAFMSGRVALSACIYGLGLKRNDEVIFPGFTSRSVANALKFEGIIPVYTDIELDTFGLDADKIEERLTTRTRAILMHHLYGLVCRDYEKIIALAKRYNLKVIEDCAHATGAEYKGIKVGNLGDAAIYSSENSKVFNTITGGLATTNSKKVAEGIGEYYDNASIPDDEMIKTQLGSVVLNYFKYAAPQQWWRKDAAQILYGKDKIILLTKEEEMGIKSNDYGQKMPGAIAEIGINQLGKIDRYNKLRRQTAKRWDKWCEENGYKKPLVVPDSEPVFLRYPVLVEDEKKATRRWSVKELGIHLGNWFSVNRQTISAHDEGCVNAGIAIRKCVDFPTLT